MSYFVLHWQIFFHVLRINMLKTRLNILCIVAFHVNFSLLDSVTGKYKNTLIKNRIFCSVMSCWLRQQCRLIFDALALQTHWQFFLFKAPHIAYGPSYQMKCTPQQMPTGMTLHWMRLLLLFMWVGVMYLYWAYSFSILGNALNQDAIQEIRQILDEHGKRKRPVYHWMFMQHMHATY